MRVKTKLEDDLHLLAKWWNMVVSLACKYMKYPNCNEVFIYKSDVRFVDYRSFSIFALPLNKRLTSRTEFIMLRMDLKMSCPIYKSHGFTKQIKFNI